MAKKKDKKSKARADKAERLTRDVGDSAHKIWLAGLGMFDSAREGSGKLFDKMVKRGEALEAQAKPKVTQAAQDVRATVRKEVRRLEAQMKTLLNKVEAWRTSPTPAPAKKKAVRKRATVKKKAAPRKAAAPKKAAAKKKATPKKAAAKKKAVRRRTSPVKKTAARQ